MGGLDYLLQDGLQHHANLKLSHSKYQSHIRRPGQIQRLWEHSPDTQWRDYPNNEFLFQDIPLAADTKYVHQ
jgi:hypothetical protein